MIYSNLSDEVKAGYYGAELNKIITALDRIQVGKITPPFKLTTISGDVVTDQDRVNIC